MGRQIGSYKILSLLGAGGMGEVYRAEDTRLGRPVALKVLPEGLAHDKERLHRFVREARAASTLNHANVAHIYEIGQSDGLHFIAMEYVEGQSLAQKLSGRPLELKEVLDIGTQAADALEEAHRRGITHRDIKSANLMITPKGQVKVLDFGLAKITRPEGEAAGSDVSTSIHTARGVVMGTLRYMSPEQVLGKELEARTDLFSLGVVLYEMTTGRLPFSGSNASEVTDRILHAQPEALARFNYEVPAELERIIRKCLEKDRERRYQSAREVLADLSRLKEGSAANTMVGTSVAQPRASLRRLVAVAAVMLMVVAAIAYALLFRRAPGVRPPEIKSLAVLPFKPLVADHRDESLEMGMADTLIVRLSSLRDVTVRPISSVRKFSGLEQDPVAAGRELGVESILDGQMQRSGDRIRVTARLIGVGDGKQLWADQFDVEFSDVFTVQDLISEKVISALELELTGEEQKRLTKHYTENAEAYQLYINGRFYWERRTLEGLKKAIEYFEQAIGKDQNYALAYAGLSDSYALLGVFHLPPKEAFPKAKEAALNALRIDDRLAEAHTALGHIRVQYEYDWVGAEREYQRAIDLKPNYVNAHHFYALYLSIVGRFDEGIEEIKRAQELEPSSLFIHTNLGHILYRAQRYDEAIDQVKRVLEMNPNFDHAHSVLGLAYLQKGMVEQAIAEFQKRKMPVTGGAGDLGQAYASAGRRSEALKEIDKLQELSTQRYVAAYNLALIYASLGDKGNALEWLEKAYEDRSTQLIWIKADPRLDNLRSEPRFKAVIKRLGLE